jgi:tetratricopeptide (TPR) repeat protein
MRRARQVIVPLLSAALVIATIPALAGRGESKTGKSRSRSPERQETGGSVSGFTLSSELLAGDPAVATALDLIEVAPNDGTSWRLLGEALASLGAFQDSIAAIERALDIDEADPLAWSDLGAAQLRAGMVSRASSSLKTALELEPFLARAHYNLGLAHSEAKRYDDALDAFELALLIEPSLADPAVNPDAASNPYLDLVKLRVYMRTSGASAALFGGQSQDR